MKTIGIALVIICALLFFLNFADNQPHEEFDEDEDDDDDT